MTVKVGNLFQIDATASSLFVRLPLIGQAHMSRATGAEFDTWAALKRTGEA